MAAWSRQSGDRLPVLIEVDAEPNRIAPRAAILVRIRRADGRLEAFIATAAVETTLEVETLAQGGLLPLILRRLTAGRAPA